MAEHRVGSCISPNSYGNDLVSQQAEFAMRQRPVPFFFRSITLMKARTVRLDTLTYYQGQFPQTRERGDRAMAVIGHPQRLATLLTTLFQRGQRLLMRRFQARGSSSHTLSPVVLISLLLVSGYTPCQVFFAIQPPGRQGNIIMITSEDSAEDTIKPRMEAVGCDPSRVLLLNTNLYFDETRLTIYERPFSLSRDMYDLEVEIKRTNAILVVIDPLMAVLGRNIDSSRDQDVREVFNPLAQLARRTGCAILIIRHLNKGNSSNILYRGAGSIGIIAAARIGLLVAHDPDDEQKRVFATIKNNLSKVATNLTFQIVENERGVPYIQWLGENHHTTSALLRPGTNLSFARQEILKALKDASGPLDTKEISEHTGLKYASLRIILKRMQDAGEIVRLYRGKYTSPNHPSMTDKSMVMNGDTNDTSATSATNSTNDLPSSEK